MSAFFQRNITVSSLIIFASLGWQTAAASTEIAPTLNDQTVSSKTGRAKSHSKAHSLLFSLGQSSTVKDNVSTQLSSLGYSGIETTSAGRGIGFSLGYRRFLTNNLWSVDFEYLDLGGRSTTISSIIPPTGKTTTQALQDVASSLPENGKGLRIMSNRHFKINPLWTVELGAGAFVEHSKREARLGTENIKLSSTSTKPILGLGIRRQLNNQFNIRAVIHHYFREGGNIDQLSIGFTRDF